MADADESDDDYQDYDADEDDGGRASKFPFKIRVRRVYAEEINFIPLNRKKRRRQDFHSDRAQGPGHWPPPPPSTVAVVPANVAFQQNERETTGELTTIEGLPKLTSLLMPEDEQQRAFHNLMSTASTVGSELLQLSRPPPPPTHNPRRLAIAWEPDDVLSSTTEMIREELEINRLDGRRVDDVSLVQTIMMQSSDDLRSHKVGDKNEVPSSIDCLVPEVETAYTLNADGLQVADVKPEDDARDKDPWMPASLFDINEDELVTTTCTCTDCEWPFEAALPEVQTEIDGVDCPSPAHTHAPLLDCTLELEAEQEQVVPRELDLNSTPIISLFGYDFEDLYAAERDKENGKESVKIEAIFSTDDIKVGEEEEECSAARSSADVEEPAEYNWPSSETNAWRHSLRLGLSRKQPVQPLHKRRDDC